MNNYKASDFRIGNLIHVYGMPLSITSTIISKIEEIHSRKKIVHDVTVIPLTEEWLRKFGFKDEPNDYYLEKDLGCNIGQLHINWRRNILWIKHHRNECSMFNPYCPKYVHELQNLFFSLTGKELKYKL